MKVKHLFRVAVLMATVAFFASCEDDSDSDSHNNHGGTGKMLVKITQISYTKYFENNNLQYTSGYADWTGFNWSGNNLTGVNNAEFYNGTWETENIPYTFIYNGNNLTEIRMNGNGYQENVYFTYNGADISEIYETWSEGSYSGWRKIQYTYNNGRIQNATRTDDDGDISTYSFTWSGDNLIAEQRYEDGQLYRTTNYTYDSKRSAYTSMSPAIALWSESFEWLSANNVILRTRQYNDGESYNQSYTYTYDGEYPVKAVLNSNESYSSERYEYTYTTYFEYADGTGASQLPQLYFVNATSNSEEWGYVNGSGAYAAGSTATLHAYSFYSYEHPFQSWSDGNTQNPRTFMVNSDVNYTAIFSNGGGGGESTLLYEGFENGIPSSWTRIDADGDGNGWLSATDVFPNSSGIGHSSSNSCAASQSYINNVGALTPDNYLVSPSVTIPNTNGYTLDWYVAAQDASYPSEYYSVYVGTMSGGTFVPYGTLYSETVSAKSKVQGTWRYRSVNLNSYKGQTVRFAFRHHDCTDMFLLLIDDVSVSNNSKSAGQSAQGIVKVRKNSRISPTNPLGLNRHEEEHRK